MSEERIAETKEELAEYVGKSWRTVYRWIGQGMPVRPDGKFDLDQIDEWLRKKKGGGGSDDVPGTAKKSRNEPAASCDDKDYWDKESKKEQALKRQLERRKLEGELIELRLVEDMFVSRILEVKALLVSFERQLPPILIQCKTDREMADSIRKFIRRALDKFARPLPPDMRPTNAA